MRVFILEDDPNRILLFREAGFNIDLFMATSVDEAKTIWDPPYEFMFLDHDLGGEQMVDSSKENTGFQFVKWLPFADKHQPFVIVHSYNPDGAKNMYNELQDRGYHLSVKMPFGPKVLKLIESLRS